MEKRKFWMQLIVLAVCLYVGLQHFNVVIGGVSYVWSLVLPFAIGSAIAFILDIPMSFFEELLKKLCKEKQGKKNWLHKLVRPLSLILAIGMIVVIILIVILVVMPALVNAVDGLIKTTEREFPIIKSKLMDVFQNNKSIEEWIAGLKLDPSEIQKRVLSVLKDGADNVWSSTLTVTRGVVSVVFNGVIAFVFACYVLLSKEKLLVQTKKLMYAVFSVKVADSIVYVGKLSNRIFSSFVTGQCIEAIILGSMFFVSMTILRMPYAILVGILISFTALIPMIGGFIGSTIGFLLILLVSPMQAVAFLVLFQVLQQIEGNLIYPHVVGESVGLPSIWVLVAVTVGGSLMGVVGMLIFIPLVSVLYTLLREWMYRRLNKKQIDEEKWKLSEVKVEKKLHFKKQK